jgi:hypothetical protein
VLVDLVPPDSQIWMKGFSLSRFTISMWMVSFRLLTKGKEGKHGRFLYLGFGRIQISSEMTQRKKKKKKKRECSMFSTPRKRKIRHAKLTKLCRKDKKKNVLWLHIN